MSIIKTHKDLDVWKKGITFVVRIYAETMIFPEHEKYGISSQLRRAAVSIPTNLAEGFGRNHQKELLQFLNIAMGSASEIDTLLLISKELKYLTDSKYNELSELLDHISRMLKNLSKSISKHE
jgi:four helix bundle protein